MPFHRPEGDSPGATRTNTRRRCSWPASAPGRGALGTGASPPTIRAPRGGHQRGDVADDGRRLLDAVPAVEPLPSSTRKYLPATSRSAPRSPGALESFSTSSSARPGRSTSRAPRWEVALIDRPVLVARGASDITAAGDWENLSILEYHRIVGLLLGSRHLPQREGIPPDVDGRARRRVLDARGGEPRRFVAFVPRRVARGAACRARGAGHARTDQVGVYAVYPASDTLHLARAAVEEAHRRCARAPRRDRRKETAERAGGVAGSPT